MAENVQEFNTPAKREQGMKGMCTNLVDCVILLVY